MKAVAIDPGGTTGYAVGLIEDGRMKVSTGQAVFTHLSLYNQLVLSSPHIIVCESFDFRRRSQLGVNLFPKELIGVVELYAQQRATDNEDHGVELCYQKPGNVLGQFYTDDVLKKDRLYKTGRPHANDACRHLLHWFTFGSGFKYNTGGYDPA